MKICLCLKLQEEKFEIRSHSSNVATMSGHPCLAATAVLLPLEELLTALMTGCLASLGFLLLHFFHDGANLGPVLEEEKFDDTISVAFILSAACRGKGGESLRGVALDVGGKWLPAFTWAAGSSPSRLCHCPAPGIFPHCCPVPQAPCGVVSP